MSGPGTTRHRRRETRRRHQLKPVVPRSWLCGGGISRALRRLRRRSLFDRQNARRRRGDRADAHSRGPYRLRRARATRARRSVFVHEDDLPASRRIPRLPPVGFFTNFWRPFVRRSILRNAVASGAFRTEDITAARPFRDGDRLDVPGRPKVIHAPGHTPGECMLYLEDREVLMSGDALVTLNLLTGEQVSPCVPYRLLNHNDAQARRSVARLRELGRVTMLPGHGRPWQGTIAEAVSGVGRFVTSGLGSLPFQAFSLAGEPWRRDDAFGR